MASTLNLFALDRDFPASRQLQVVVEQNPDNNNKKENRLLVTDNKSLLKLEEIRILLEGQSKSTRVLYPTKDIIATSTNPDKSQLVNVVNVDKINIYYSDQVNTEGHSIKVMGRLGHNTTNNDIYTDIPINDNTGDNVELYRFIPRSTSDDTGGNSANTFNVIDLNVNGVAYIYLQITVGPSNTTTIEDIKNNASAFVSAQYTEFTSQPGGGSSSSVDFSEVVNQLTVLNQTTTDKLSEAITNLETIEQGISNNFSTAIDNLSSIEQGMSNDVKSIVTINQNASDTASNILKELELLTISYQLTNHFLGSSYNLFVPNIVVEPELYNMYEAYSNDGYYNETYSKETYYNIFTLWNSTDSINVDLEKIKFIKINKIVLNIDKSLIFDKLYENGLYNPIDDINLGGVNTFFDSLDHVNLKISVVDIDGSPELDSDTNKFILHSTTGDEIKSHAAHYSSRTDLPISNKKPFTNVAINSSNVYKEINFSDVPFLIRNKSGIVIEGNSFAFLSVVNFNVYYNEFSVNDILKIIPELNINI